MLEAGKEFRKAGLLRNEEEDAATADEGFQRMFDSDTDEEEFFGFERDNEGETGRVAGGEATLRLFKFPTLKKRTLVVLVRRKKTKMRMND
ncbi:hypothetical protein AAFF_G00433810 [Aldrovandia affinis]|uniref:Uncharacterized protein n=1 Tax=Aldrovandia affinis TaxID=143900 RepID=A0AAD7R2V7_9TELE|nr:hypothetical protein AAFF_G00433810 [Aldrovandia affinis]